MIQRLSEMDYGERGIIREIRKSRHKLNCMGVREGKNLKMVTRQPIKGPVDVIVGDVEVAMGLELADEVIVEVISPTQGE